MIFKQNSPIYLQIAERIMDEILTGVYPANERIPSVREYGITLEVNVNTMVKVYDHLTSIGLIYNKRGLGYFVNPGAKQTIHNIRKEEFIEEAIPEIARSMQTLGITVNELTGYINKVIA